MTTAVTTAEELSKAAISTDAHETDDAMVCYCYKYKLSKLKTAYAKCGSLAKLQEETNVGNGCGGCRVVLNSIFGETPADINQTSEKPVHGTLCSKPGSRIMKGFIIADGELESKVYSSNAVAPQLGDCDTTMNIEYALVDHRAQPVIVRSTTLKKNEVFVFDTRKENLPRPFYGMLLYGLGRSNYGAARFNIYWSNGNSTATTHENNAPGRPRVYLPLKADKRFLDGDTVVYLGLMNPHQERIPYSITVMDIEKGVQTRFDSYLDAFNSSWVNANEFLYGPALKQYPEGKFILKIESANLNIHRSMVEYIFFYNKRTKVWTSNHL